MDERLTFIYDEKQGTKIVFAGKESDGGQVKKKTGKTNKKPVSTFYEPDASLFQLRGKDYLKDKVKIPSKPAAFELVSFTVISTPDKLFHVAENLKSLKAFLAEYPDDFFFIAVRIVPASPIVVVITISKRIEKEESGFADLFETYLRSGDDFKNKRLKYVAKLENAPWAVLASVKAMGGEKPVIMGNGYLYQIHYQGANYYEVDVDISSSFVARQIAGSVSKYANYFKVSECFVIEGQDEEELPEQAIFCISMEHIDIKAISYDLTVEDRNFFAKNKFPEQPKEKK